jgi:hypothetical protein
LDVLAICLAGVRSGTVTECPTLDGGMTWEVEGEPTERDLLLMAPDTGTPVYFTARGPDWPHPRAGVVLDEEAAAALVAWVEGRRAAFPRSGLIIG